MGSPVNAIISKPRNNLLINGDFRYWQRFGTTAVPTSKTYTADRWFARRSGNSAGMTLSRQAGELSTYCLRVQRDNGNALTATSAVAQPIEFLNAVGMRGKILRLTFRARAGANYSAASSILYSRVIYGGTQDAPVDLDGAGWTNLGFTETQHTLTTSFQTFTLVLPVTNASTTNILVQFYTVPVGTAGAADYFEIENAHLSEDVGSVIPFSLYGNNAHEELQACLRYYEKTWAIDIPAGTSGDTKFYTGISNAGGAGAVSEIRYAVEKRSNPTIAYWNGGISNTAFFRRSATDTTTTIDVTGLANSKGFSPTNVTTIAAFVIFQLGFSWAADAEL
jgi:hypothetical protein